MFVLGETVILEVVAPVLHKYVPPPEAERVVLLPRQIVSLPEMDAVGLGFTVIVTLPLLMLTHPVVVSTAST